MKLRITFLALLLVCGAALVVMLYIAKARSPLDATLASSFQLLGTPVKLLDRMASRVVPVSTLDERELGDTFRERYDPQARTGDDDQSYLDDLMAEIRPFTHKPFPYRAYVIGGYGNPNAMALPGGVILVTRELLKTLHSESELVAVLAHEVGHIERGHCFDLVRFQLLMHKTGNDSLGVLADMAAQALLDHAYSKTMENEADEYAYELLANSRYDPRGVGRSFASLLQYLNGAKRLTSGHVNPLRDYFMSHPPLEIREAEFSGRASVWWNRHMQERRYVGRQNLLDRKALSVQNMNDEWKLSGAG